MQKVTTYPRVHMTRWTGGKNDFLLSFSMHQEMKRETMKEVHNETCWMYSCYSMIFLLALALALLCFSTVAVLQDSSDPGVVDLYYTMHCLSSEDIKGLPPGGGLPAK